MKNILFIFLFSQGLFAQKTDISQLIPSLNNYRSKFIDLINHRDNDLVKFIEEREELGVSRDSILSLLNDRYYSNDWNRLSEERREMLLCYSCFFDFMNMGYIGVSPPFKFKISKNDIKEIQFLNIVKGDVVLEIGAGEGEFSQLLGMLKLDLEHYINEIKDINILYLNNIKESGLFGDDLHKIKIIQGNAKSTGTDIIVDKIIIRQTFHHFNHRSQMLKSIKKNLKLGGELYLNESYIRNIEKGKVCPKSLEEKRLKRYFEKHGFVLKEEIVLDDFRVMLRYKLENKE